MDADDSDSRYVSRGGVKLQAALQAFEVAPTGWVCADFGANVGGFTDCLLAAGARRVYAVDTGYGELAWRLRNDPRVVVMERTNA
ncbi:MAG: SAM-dependent methyltransferase, partial [Planctomycetota bacterium]